MISELLIKNERNPICWSDECNGRTITDYIGKIDKGIFTDGFIFKCPKCNAIWKKRMITGTVIRLNNGSVNYGN